MYDFHDSTDIFCESVIFAKNTDLLGPEIYSLNPKLSIEVHYNYKICQKCQKILKIIYSAQYQKLNQLNFERESASLNANEVES